jgi:hypothetical protein
MIRANKQLSVSVLLVAKRRTAMSAKILKGTKAIFLVANDDHWVASNSRRFVVSWRGNLTFVIQENPGPTKNVQKLRVQCGAAVGCGVDPKIRRPLVDIRLEVAHYFTPPMNRQKSLC